MDELIGLMDAFQAAPATVPQPAAGPVAPAYDADLIDVMDAFEAAPAATTPPPGQSGYESASSMGQFLAPQQQPPPQDLGPAGPQPSFLTPPEPTARDVAAATTFTGGTPEERVGKAADFLTGLAKGAGREAADLGFREDFTDNVTGRARKQAEAEFEKQTGLPYGPEFREHFEEVLKEAPKVERLRRAVEASRKAGTNKTDYTLSRVPFVGAGYQVGMAEMAIDAANRLKEGKATEVDYRVLGDLLAQGERDENRSFLGKVTDVLTQIPGFAAEFALTGGAFTGGKKVAEKLATRALGKAAQGTAGRLATRALGVAAGVEAQTLANPGRVAEAIVRRQVPGVGLGEDRVDVQAPDESLAESAVKGVLDATIETGTEHAGAAFPLIGRLLKKVPVGARGAAVRDATGRLVRKLSAGAGAVPGFQGMPAELAEERLGEVLRGATGVEEDYGAVARGDVRQLAVEALAFSLFGAGSAGLARLRSRPAVVEAAKSGQPGALTAALDQLARSGVADAREAADLARMNEAALAEEFVTATGPLVSPSAPKFTEPAGEAKPAPAEAPTETPYQAPQAADMAEAAPEQTAPQEQPPARQPFPSQAEVEIEEARRTGKSADFIEGLKAGGVSAVDDVTGWQEGRTGKARSATAKRAAERARAGEPATYAEIDLRNLGGLNAAFGHEGANRHFRAMADILREELTALSPDAQLFRHGGDEVSAVVVGHDAAAVEQALTRAREKVAEYARQNGLDAVPHTKAGRPGGTGITFGTAAFDPAEEPGAVFGRADRRVEAAKKKETAGVKRGTPEAPGAVAPGGGRPGPGAGAAVEGGRPDGGNAPPGAAVQPPAEEGPGAGRTAPGAGGAAAAAGGESLTPSQIQAEIDVGLDTAKAQILFEFEDRKKPFIGWPRDARKQKAAEQLVAEGRLRRDGNRLYHVPDDPGAAATEEGDFAAEVLDLARAVPQTRSSPKGRGARFGDDAVYIGSLWDAYRKKHPGADRDDFNRQLVAAHRAGTVRLTRADLVEVMHPADVAESHVALTARGPLPHDTPDKFVEGRLADFHFVKLPVATPERPAAPARQQPSKPVHEMTRAEYLAESRAGADLPSRRQAVQRALRDGLTVPPEVLAEFPDLKPPGAGAEPEPAPAAARVTRPSEDAGEQLEKREARRQSQRGEQAEPEGRTSRTRPGRDVGVRPAGIIRGLALPLREWAGKRGGVEAYWKHLQARHKKDPDDTPAVSREDFDAAVEYARGEGWLEPEAGRRRADPRTPEQLREDPDFEEFYNYFAEVFDPPAGVELTADDLAEFVTTVREAALDAEGPARQAAMDVLHDFADQIETVKPREAKKRKKQKGVQARTGPSPGVQTGTGAGDPIGSRAIVNRMGELWDVPVRIGRFLHKALGIYKAKPEVVRLKGKFAGDLAVATHEVAHHIDKTNGLSDGADGAALDELASLDYDAERQDPKEGFAEYVRHYLTADDAATVAPTFHRAFSAWLDNNEDQKARFAEARGLIDRFRSQGPLNTILGAISPDAAAPAKAGVAERLVEWLHRQYADFKDPYHAFRRFGWAAESAGSRPGRAHAPYEYALAMGHNAPTWASKAVAEGPFKTSDFQPLAGGLNEVLAEFTDAEIPEVAAYLVAGRSVEVFESGRQAGPFTKEDAEAVVAQYAADPRFDRARQKFKAYRNALVDVMADAGALTGAEAEKIKDSSEWATPLFRVREAGGTGGAGQKLIDLPPAFKRLKGSGRQIVDPFHGVIGETFKVYSLAVRSNMMRRLTDLGDKQAGLGQWVEKVDPLLVPTKLNLGEIKAQLVDAGMEEDAIDELGRGELIAAFRNELAEGSGAETPAELEAAAEEAVADKSVADIRRMIIDGGETEADRDRRERKADAAIALGLTQRGLQIWRPDYFLRKQGEPVGVVVKNGKKELYQFHPELFRALNGTHDELQFGFTLGILSRLAALQRLGATGINPSFTIPNLTADYLTFFMRRRHAGVLAPLGVIRDFAREKLAGQPDPFRELYNLMGVPLTTNVGGDVDQRRRAEARLRGQRPGLRDRAKSGLDGLRELIGWTEIAPRLAEFKASLLKDGWTEARLAAGEKPPVEALVRAANAANDVTVNFRRMGPKMRRLNAIFPWTNASVEALDGFLRTATRDPKTFAVRAAVIASAALAYWWRVKDDDCFREAQPWLKYGNVIVDCDKGVRVPLRGEAANLIIAPVIALADAAYRRDPQAAKEGLTHGAKGTVLDVPTPAGWSVVEALINYDTFRGRPIVDEQGPKLRPEDQAQPYNTELSRWAGALLGVSPAKLEHVAEGLTGGLYGRVEKPVEAVLGDRPYTWRDFPVLERFAVRKEYSQTLDEFYAAADAAEADRNSAKLHGGPDAELATRYERASELGELMGGLRALKKGKTGKEERFETERYEIGLARWALGKEELERYPNPLTAADAPGPVRKAADEWLGAVLYEASAGRPTRPAGQPVAKYHEKVAAWEARMRNIEPLVGELNLSGEERARALRAYYKAHGRTITPGGDFARRMGRLSQ